MSWIAGTAELRIATIEEKDPPDPHLHPKMSGAAQDQRADLKVVVTTTHS